MPVEMERALKKSARKKFGSTTSERARKYIYGRLRKTGWVPSTQKRKKNKRKKSKQSMWSGVS